MTDQCHLQQDVEFAGLEVLAPHQFDAGPRPAADAVDLAPVHRQHGHRRARIARDQLELGAQQVLDEIGEHFRVRTRPLSADHGPVPAQFGEGLGRRPVRGDADRDLVVHRPQPVELGRVELRARAAEQLMGRRAARDHAEHGTVLGRRVVKPVGQDDGGGAGLVLDDHFRLAGNIAGEMGGQQARVGVVSAARREADKKRKGLALVEIGHRFRLGGRQRHAERDQGDGTEKAVVA